MGVGVPSVPGSSGKGPGTWPNKRTRSFNYLPLHPSNKGGEHLINTSGEKDRIPVILLYKGQ